MRARSEAALAVLTLCLLAALVALLGRAQSSTTSEDERPSTFLAGPGGARALLEALRGSGVEVRRFRERPQALTSKLGRQPLQAFVVLGPSYRFSPPERSRLLAFNQDADLVLAGQAAEPLMRCFGYRVRVLHFDSVQAVPPGRRPTGRPPWVHASLEATNERESADSSRAFDVGRSVCRVPEFASVDTLLLSSRHRPVVVRLRRADTAREVVLVADEELFRNRSLRRSEAGPFVLGLFVGRYRRVVFEEYHHGFGASGSLAAATLAWSRRSPWGWAVWQCGAVAVLALLFGAVRFGPAQPGIARTRRSPLEHVRALAVALSAARGADLAIGAIVRGLRRRLVPAALRGRTRGDWRQWLAQLDRPGATPQVRASLATLTSLTRPGQPSASVLRAANAVEDLWQDLKP